MDLKNLLLQHKEKLWVLCISETYANEKLSPLLDLIDWYQNQWLTKCLLQGQIPLSLGSKTLLASKGILNAERFLVYGMGGSKSLSGPSLKKIAMDIDQTAQNLNNTKPWIVFSSDIGASAIEEFKTHTQSPVTLG